LSVLINNAYQAQYQCFIHQISIKSNTSFISPDRSEEMADRDLKVEDDMLTGDDDGNDEVLG
jgi:hypothetical protein